MCVGRNALISGVVSTLKEKRSKSRWNDVKTLCGPNGTLTPEEVSEITLQLRNNPHLALRFFLWSDHNSLCTHDLLSYSTIVHVLARSRRFKTLTLNLITTAIRVSDVNPLDGPDHRPPKIFEALVKSYRRCDSAPFVFDLLIRACLKSRTNLDRSISIVRLLRSRNIWPTIGTCNLLIRAVSRSRGSDDALAMYREVFDDEARVRAGGVMPNLQTFNVLMLCFYQDGIWERVEEVWVEMGKVLDCCPNVFSYCVRLAAVCDQGKMSQAMEIWEEMQIKGVKADVMAYNTLISGFCNSLDLGKAEEVFQQMGLSDVHATSVTYEHLIYGYCKIGDVDSAILLYKDMCRRGFKPESCTVDSLVGGLCDKSRVVEGVEVFRDVMKMEGFHPGRLAFEFLIKGLCEDGKIEEALRLQTKMVGNGFEPNLEIYKAFIRAYSKCGDKEKARKLTEEMITFGSQPECERLE